MLERISTSQNFNDTLALLNKHQAELADLRRQISSGIKAASFPDLGADTLRTLDLQSAVRSTEQYQEQNQITHSRLGIMDSLIGQLQDLAQDVQQQVILKRSPSGLELDLTTFAESTLDRIAALLNTRSAGRFLFAGSKTDTMPVTGTLDNLDSNNNATDSYYRGDDVKLTARASRNLTVEYGVTANEQGFQDLIGAVNMLLKEPTTANLQQAANLAQSGIDGLSDVRSRVGLATQLIEEANTQHERVGAQLQQVLQDAIGTDIAEATIRISENELVLTASFQTFARIQRLTLAEFLD